MRSVSQTNYQYSFTTSSWSGRKKEKRKKNNNTKKKKNVRRDKYTALLAPDNAMASKHFLRFFPTQSLGAGLFQKGIPRVPFILRINQRRSFLTWDNRKNSTTSQGLEMGINVPLSHSVNIPPEDIQILFLWLLKTYEMHFRTASSLTGIS